MTAPPSSRLDVDAAAMEAHFQSLLAASAKL
jgi:hypothetical protein